MNTETEEQLEENEKCKFCKYPVWEKRDLEKHPTYHELCAIEAWFNYSTGVYKSFCFGICNWCRNPVEASDYSCANVDPNGEVYCSNKSCEYLAMRKFAHENGWKFVSGQRYFNKKYTDSI